MPNFRLTLAYDGTASVGWQRQAQGVSIQGLIEDAIAPLEGAPVTVFGAGRTDAGVHALAQVASVSMTRDIEAGILLRAINSRLPATVRVVDASMVPSQFHARFDATAKTYRYRIWNADVLNPFERAYVWHVTSPLDAAAMNEAARCLEGRHDFAAFQTAGAEVQTTERVVYSSRVRRDGALVMYEIRGNGFLRHMVRGIVGSLVDVGRHRYPTTWLQEVLSSKARESAGRTAPAAGLFLVSVEYNDV